MSFLDAIFGDKKQDAPTPATAPDGTNGVDNVDVPEDLQRALWDLSTQYLTADEQSRYQQVRKSLKAHSFIQNRQYLVYDSAAGFYRAASNISGTGVATGSNANDVDSAYSINLYEAHFLSFSALVSANRPTLKFPPPNPDDPDDVKANRAADLVMKIFEGNNPPQKQLLDEALALWCDETYGSYVRHVVNGDLYGYTEQPEYETVQKTIGPDPMGPTAPVTQQKVDPMTGQPVTKKIPNGAEIRTVVPTLQLSVPPNANTQDDFPYIVWDLELDKAKIKATYPNIADQIDAQKADDRSTGSDGSMAGGLARRARVQLSNGTTVDNRRVVNAHGDLVTFSRRWLRPWTFYSLEADQRDQLLELFPDGVHVAFAGEVFCEARNEKMDDHWRICHAKPGPGQIRPAIGDSLVQVQEIFNDLTNFRRDIAEFGMPLTFVDPEKIDVNNLQKQRVKGGAFIPVKGTPDKPIQNALYVTQALQISPQTVAFAQELANPVAQFLTGNFPAAFGGDTGANDTAHGIALERDQAMGRIGMYWHAIKDHHADFAPLVVAEFAKNRLDPVRVTEKGAGDKYKGVVVDPRDLQQGSIGVPETLEDYPTTWPQRKDTLMNILQGPMGSSIATMLKNADELKRTIGLSAVQFPGESQYKMEMNIIEQMLEQQPLPPPPPPPPPMMPPGMMPPPPPPPMPQPSIPFDPLVCDPPITIQAFKDWAQSEDGQKAAIQNPMGYQNVRLRAQQAQMAMAPPPPPPGGPGGPGGPPPGGQPHEMGGPNAGGPGGPPSGTPGGPPAPPGKIGLHHGPPGSSPLGPEGNHAPPPNPQAAH